MRKAVSILLGFTLLFHAASGHADTWAIARETADTLGSELLRLARNVTAIEWIVKGYEELLGQGAISVRKLNGAHAVRSFSRELQRVLESKTQALKAIKDKTEELENEYTYDPNIQPFTYFNSMDYSGYPPLRKEPTFFTNRPVNFHNACYHVPANVYEKSPEILNTIKWLQNLNPEFYRLQSLHKSLLWQYIGMPSGIFTMYPGIEWRSRPSEGRYDCRRRGWYIDGASSDKDMVILLDRSGSMIGSNFKIAQAAISELITSLQENDFFNIVEFTEAARSLVACQSKLLQATKQNKEMLQKAVFASSPPHGPSDIVAALRKAFEILQEGRKNRPMTSGCHQVIVILTDGIEDLDEVKKVHQEYNAEGQVRIFTYRVGMKNRGSNLGAMKWIACKSRGKFYELETSGDVWDTIFDYVTVLGEPLAYYANLSTPKYVPIYLDFQGVGMVTSVVLPAFKNTSASGSVLLGVVGQDITLSELEQIAPIHLLGPHGFAFSLNNNGFMLFHPLLKGQLGHLLNPPTVYLQHITYSEGNASEELTHTMVNRETGQMDFNTYILSPRHYEARFQLAKMSYFYTPTNDTPFSTGLAVPHFSMYQIEAFENSTNYLEAVAALQTKNDSLEILIAPWNYCNISSKAQENRSIVFKVYPSSEEIYQYLNSSDIGIPDNCDKDLVSRLLVSAIQGRALANNYWSNERNARLGVAEVFYADASGLTFNLPTGKKTNLVQRNASGEIFYARATESLNSEMLTFIYEATAATTNWPQQNRLVTASAPVIVGKERILAGVVGMHLREIALQRMLQAASIKHSNGKCFNQSCSATVGGDCADNQTMACYLVDYDGFVVTSNQNPSQAGKFLGMVEGTVMRSILNDTVFDRVRLKDYQANCPTHIKKASSASTLSKAIWNIPMLLTSMVQTIAMFTSWLLLMSWKHPTVEASNEAVKNYSCTKWMIFYKVNTTKLPHYGTAQFLGCSKSYAVLPIRNTNLLLVSTEKWTLPCSKLDWKLSRDPIKIDNDYCHNYNSHRRTLQRCARFKPVEHTTPRCKGIKSNGLSKFTLLIGLCMAVNSNLGLTPFTINNFIPTVS